MVVASDANPGTAPTESLPLALALAVRELRSHGRRGDPRRDARGGARRSGSAIVRGALAPGFDADLVVWDLPHENAIVQPWGVSKTRLVLRAGQIARARTTGPLRLRRRPKRAGANRYETLLQPALPDALPLASALALTSTDTFTLALMLAAASSAPLNGSGDASRESRATTSGWPQPPP